jgi:hypothetical protein
VTDDTHDEDGDPATDKYVAIGWADIGGNWPNLALPVQLFVGNFTLAGGLANGDQRIVRFTASSTAAGYTFEARPLTVVASSVNLDADGNCAADALTDGILILRYLFDPQGTWPVADALGAGAARTTRDAIRTFLDGGRTNLLDADGNGAADALTDGILILRYLFDPGGSWPVSDALGSGATRTTRADIKAFLDPFVPVCASATDALLVASSGTLPASEIPVAFLTQEDVQLLADEAIAQWVAAGLPEVQAEWLSQVAFVVTDLPGLQVGAAGGNVVFLDRDAQGYGWFTTPASSKEEQTGRGERGRTPLVRNARILEEIDLLTVIAHELGHVLRLGHDDGSLGGLMQDEIQPGVRRLPGPAEVDAVLAGDWRLL